MPFHLLPPSLLKCLAFSMWTGSESYCFVETVMRMELSFESLLLSRSYRFLLSFILLQTHYCGIGHEAMCYPFHCTLCLIKTKPHLFCYYFFFLVYVINTQALTMSCFSQNIGNQQREPQSQAQIQVPSSTTRPKGTYFATSPQATFIIASCCSAT